jgi:O-antigen ligase
MLKILLPAAGGLAPLMGYLPGTSLPPLIAVLGGIVAFIGFSPRLRPPSAALTATCLGFVALGVITYSSDVNAALDSALLFIEIGGLIALGARLKDHAGLIWRTVAAWVLVALADAALVVYFRLVPDAELSWFQGPIAPFLIAGGSLRSLFTTAGNNALAADKAGAFFPNANAGSAMLGVAFILAIALAKHSAHRRWWLAAVAFGVSILASGSTAGLLLLVSSLVLIAVGRLQRWLLKLPLLAVLTAGLIYGGLALGEQATSNLDVVTRGLLWRLAATAISLHPVFGLGFGGWDKFAGNYFGLVGGASSYPPHNLLLNSWVQMGAVGAILVVVFFAQVLISLHRSTLAESGLISIAVLWTVLHSMADNTSIFNDFHTTAPLALLVGLGTAFRQRATVAVQAPTGSRTGYPVPARQLASNATSRAKVAGTRPLRREW